MEGPARWSKARYSKVHNLDQGLATLQLQFSQLVQALQTDSTATGTGRWDSRTEHSRGAAFCSSDSGGQHSVPVLVAVTKALTPGTEEYHLEDATKRTVVLKKIRNSICVLQRQA